MKTASIFVAVCATLLVMSGCGQNSHEASESSNSKKEIVAQSSASGTEPEQDGRKFIRTSEMKFRVKDVVSATTQIEQITKQNHGFVTYTNMESTMENQKVIQKSLDSSLESIQYTVVNDITLRVPNATLDSTLYAISTLVDYMDHRIIKAEDVALQIKANQKTERRATENTQRIQQTIDNKSGKVKEAVDAEMTAMNQRENADNAALSNLSLKDQVEYSTVSISIYQRTETKYWNIINDNNSIAKTAIGIRLWDSIKTGWYFMEDLFVGILNLWIVFVFALIGFWIYRKYFRKKPILLAK